MATLQLTRVPVAKTGMLIRKPAAEVFAAFVEPDITTRFWFSKSSGRLEPGSKIKWEWEMFGASTELTVKALEHGIELNLVRDRFPKGPKQPYLEQ